MFNDGQHQKAGDNSQQVQVTNSTINFQNGMSFPEVLSIARVLFEENFPILRQQAMDTAKERADEIANELFGGIFRRCPEKLSKFSEPNIQYCLVEIEKEYARSGKPDLKATLIDLLIRLVESDSNDSLHNICLQEAISVAPSLTAAQLDMLSLKFLLAYTKQSGISQVGHLAAYLHTIVLPFYRSLFGKKDLSHLISFRCGYFVEYADELGEILWYRYPDTAKSIVKDGISLVGGGGSLVRQNVFVSENGSRIPIGKYYADKIPAISAMVETYDSLLKGFELTSLGKLLGAVNAERKRELNLDLSIWI